MSQVKGKNLNQDAALEAYKGGNWGADDQSRYDAIMKARTVSILNLNPNLNLSLNLNLNLSRNQSHSRSSSLQQMEDRATAVTGGTSQTSNAQNYSNQRVA